MAHAPAAAQQGYPHASRYTGNISKLAVGPYVAAYAAKLAPAQRTAFYCMPASQQAATAGVATYQGQYQYRQWLRSSGARANGNWGQPGTPGAKVGKAPAAHAAAAKLAKAGGQGAQQAKRQGQVQRTAQPTAAPAAPAPTPQPQGAATA